MRKILVWLMMAAVIWLAGCGSAVAAGGDMAGGISGGDVAGEAMQGSASGEAVELAVEDVAAQLDFGRLDESLANIGDYFSESYGSFDFGEFWEQVKQGNFQFGFREFFQMLLDMFFGDIKSCFGTLVQLLALAVVAALLVNFSGSFTNRSAAFARGIVYVVMISAVLRAFVICGSSVTAALGLMTDFLYAMIPVLLTLFVAMGGVSAIGLYNPLLMFAVAACMNIVNYFILPLVYCNAGLTVAGNISSDFDLSKLSKFLKTIAVGVLTLTFTLFSAIIGVVGLGSAALDGLTLKTAKSAIGIFVPVVGRSIADIFGTLMGTALVLKNCLGIAGILIIVAICMVPAVKTLIMSWIFKLCGAVAEPLGDKKLADTLTNLGGVLTVMFAVAAACGIFFFFLLAITMAMGNVNLAIS